MLPGPHCASVARNSDGKLCPRQFCRTRPVTVRERLVSLADGGTADLVLTTGGTGIGPRDSTPEATTETCQKLLPGIPEMMREIGRKKNPRAALSRGVAGVRGQSLIVNLPGSPRGAIESLDAVAELLPHAIEVLRGARHDWSKFSQRLQGLVAPRYDEHRVRCHVALASPAIFAICRRLRGRRPDASATKAREEFLTMNILLFGATGMVGHGVLRECLLDRDVQLVETIGRKSNGIRNPKIQEIVHPDLSHYESIEQQLTGFDACFFCLGVTSSGMKEADYRRVTYDITIAAASTLARLNPGMTFIYISGAGADSSEKGRTMWARVRGKTENDLLRLPFNAVYIFRSAIIQPLHGVQSRTAAYRIFYSLAKPLLPLFRRVFSGYISTTEQIGRAMLIVARNGAAKRILESRDIVEIAILK